MMNMNLKKLAIALALFGTVAIGSVALASNGVLKPAYVGPRTGIPLGAPKAYGFWSFAVLDGGKISRSGQPLMSEFKWLKKSGWKSVVDLRTDGEYKEVGDDLKLSGFKALGFNYLALPMRDGAAPTIDQAKQFLKFATDPANQPVEVHCRGGYGRTGTLIALYRYAVDGWTMPQAISESRLFQGGVDAGQQKWLLNWAKKYPKTTKE
jgi:protein-tyrosine phosphatase